MFMNPTHPTVFFVFVLQKYRTVKEISFDVQMNFTELVLFLGILSSP